MLMLLFVHSPSAQISTFCGAVIPTSSNFFGNASAISSIFAISLVIMLLMAGISAMLWALGYSFRMNGLIRASRQELGEIAITMLVVFIFVGAFSAVSSLATGPPSLLSGTGAYSASVFMDDCNQLVNHAQVLFQYSFDIGFINDLTLFASSLTIDLHPDGLGISFSPLSGYATATKVVGLLFIFTGVMAGLLLGVGVALGIFYVLMPIFLFAGIILRTLPWTRPAGGAFLGLFVGFYIVFPILLHFLLFNSPPFAAAPPVLGGSIWNFLANPGATFTLSAGLLQIIDPAFSTQIIITILIPALYATFSFAFSFIISFDFAEAAGAFLGSPTLRTSQALNKLL